MSKTFLNDQCNWKDMSIDNSLKAITKGNVRNNSSAHVGRSGRSQTDVIICNWKGLWGQNLKLSNHFSCRFFCLLLGIFQCRKTILKLLAIKKKFEEKTFWFFSKLEMNEEDSFREEGRKSSVKLLIKMAFPPGKCLTNKVPNLACLLLQVLLAVNVLGYLIWHIFAC